jgi:hypothetical protein
VSEFGPLYDTATTALQVVVDAAAAAQGSAPPSVAKLDESAKEVLRDMEVIHGALLDQRAKIAGQGNPARGVGVPIAIGNATPIGAEGGLAGTRVDIDVPLQVFPTP